MPYDPAQRNPTFAQVLAQVGYSQETCDRFSDVILPFELMPHQLTGLHYALYYSRAGAFFPPRCGKTIVMMLLAIFYARHDVRTMQVMPPGLFRQFFNDYHDIQNHGLKIHVFNQGPAQREKLLTKWASHPESCPDVVLLSQPIFKQHWDSLYLQKFRNLHVDEAHAGLQDETNQFSRTLKKYIEQNEGNRLVLSTGTPIPSRIENAFGTVRLLNPTAYRSRMAFDNAHVIKKPIMVPGSARTGFSPRQIQVVSGYERLALLHSNLYAQAVAAEKLVVLNLEAPNIQTISFELHPAHRTLYARLLRDRILALEDEEILDARTAQKLRQTALQLISCPEDYDEKIGPKKNALYETLHDLMETLDVERNKIVVFANFTRSVEGIARAFKDLNPAIVYGPNGANRNALNVERFRNDEACRLMVANPVAGGVGFKLGDICTTVIFAEPTSSPGVFDQSLSRVMLKGQTEPVLCYILRAEKTLAPLAIESMLGRVKDINAVMRTSKSVFDTLLGEPITEEQYEFTMDESAESDAEETASAEPIEEGWEIVQAA